MQSSSGHSHCCGHTAATPSAQQNLDELDFQRGVWSAAMDGELGRVASYLSDGGDPNAIDSGGYTALHYASRNGHREICSALLDSGANVNTQTRSGGASALHRAAYQGRTEIVRLLLSRRADSSLLDADSKSALHKAVERNRLDVCKLLVSSNPAMAAVKDTKGKMPADYVTEENNELKHVLQGT